VKFGAGFLTIAVTLGVAMPALAQDDVETRLRKRLNQEMVAAVARLGEILRESAREELAIATFPARIDRLANNLVDDPLHNRLKKFLLSRAGKGVVQKLMYETFESRLEMKENGRLRVREGTERFWVHFLDDCAPIEETLVAPRKCDGLGMAFTELSRTERLWTGITRTNGIKVTDVTEGSPAAKAGLQKDDFILVIDASIVSNTNVDDVIKSLAAGREFELTYWRDGKIQKTTLTLDQRRPK
jgi:hypothetical protein